MSLNPGSARLDENAKLGSGSFGDVYRGRYKDHEGNEHDVAIKLSNDLALRAAQECLVKELEVFDHLGQDSVNDGSLDRTVVRCFGGRVTERRWDFQNMQKIEMGDRDNFLVLELHPGSFADLLSDKAAMEEMTYADVIRIFSRLARGLDYLHQNQIVHHDLNPRNVLIDGEGWPLLTDFGFSKIRIKTSITPQNCGTIGYIAPELRRPLDRNSPPRVTDNLDMYSFGVMLGECLTGESPSQDEVTCHEKPEELWALVRECCIDFERDEENCVKRPTPAEVMTRLQGMQNAGWSDNPLR